MSKARNTDLPQHDLDQGHYGEMPLTGLPSATGYPSGSAFLWDGGSWYYGTVSQGSGSSTDEKVKVSSNDTTTSYLLNKLTAGTNVTLTETNDGGNETITIASTGSSSTGVGAGITAQAVMISGTQTITTTEQDVPGTYMTLNVMSGTTALVWGTFDIETTSAGGTTIIGRLALEGVNQTGEVILIDDNSQRWTLGQHW